jgi:hypothetical protein
MRPRFRLALALAALVAALSTASPATAAEPIGPHQHFVGIVNGLQLSSAPPVVYTFCAGPIWAGRTGSILGGQTLEVRHVRAGHGNTGGFNSVNAWVVQDTSKGAPQQIRFTTYATPQPFPAGAQVPCDGDGQVEFSACPYLAPCAFGWTPVLVPVRFVNVAY